MSRSVDAHGIQDKPPRREPRPERVFLGLQIETRSLTTGDRTQLRACYRILHGSQLTLRPCRSFADPRTLSPPRACGQLSIYEHIALSDEHNEADGAAAVTVSSSRSNLGAVKTWLSLPSSPEQHDEAELPLPVVCSSPSAPWLSPPWPSPSPLVS